MEGLDGVPSQARPETCVLRRAWQSPAEARTIGESDQIAQRTALEEWRNMLMAWQPGVAKAGSDQAPCLNRRARN